MPQQMGGAPQGAAPMPRPVRRGTSKAVPVVVSAGLAVGVFCGLLFGVGTGKKEADAAPSASNVKKEPESNAAPAGLGASTTTPAPAAKPTTTATTPTTPAAGSGAGSGAGSATAVAGTTPTTPTTPAKVEKKVKLIVSVKPEAAASIAKVLVDGTAIEGMTTDILGDKKQVKVEVKAPGYRTAEKKLDLVGDETTLEIELSKRPAGGTTVHPPKRPERPPSGGNGLIDI
jgi:hypothetical protein